MANQRRQAWRDMAAVAAIALAANLAYLACTAGNFLFPDSLIYLVLARNLLAGLGFVAKPGVAETIRTPGYPLLLAAMGAHVGPVILLQHCLNAAITAGTFLGARRIGGSRLAAYAAGLFVALDTPTIHYANKILSETLFTGVLLLVFLGLLSVTAWGDQLQGTVDRGSPGERSDWMWRMLITGLGTGVLVLIRPVAIAAFAVFAIWMIVCRVPARWVLVFVLTALLIPAGWAMRNQKRTGVFTVSSIGGTNLLLFRAAGAIVMDQGSSDFRADLLRVQTQLLADAETEIEDTLGIPDAEELPHAVLSRDLARIAVRTIREHPRGFLLLTLRGLAINLFHSRSEAMEVISQLPHGLVRFAIRLWTIGMVLLALAGVIGLWTAHRRLEAMLIVITIGYFLVISAGGESESRFRVPVVPMEAMAAGAGLEMLVLLAQGRDTAGTGPRR